VADAQGFELFGEVLGGGIDREGAFREGLKEGGQAIDAVAKARIRVDTAKKRDELAGALKVMGIENPDQVAIIMLSGQANFPQATQGLGDLFELGQRQNIADPETGIAGLERSRAAIGDAPFDPIKGVGAGLFTEMFGEQAGELQVAPTGTALIDQREQAARLSEARRLFPDDFKSTTTVNLGLGDTGLDELIDTPTIVPPDFDPTAAVGLGGIIRNAANIVAGLGDFDVPAPETLKAKAIINQLATISTLTGSVAIPGRPTNEVREALGGLEVHPADVLKGDAIAMENWRRQLAWYDRQFEQTRKRLKAGTLKVGSKAYSDEIAAAQMLSGLLADFRAVLSAAEAAEKERRGEPVPFELPPGYSIVTEDTESEGV
jgi:hypothetical protein